LGQGKGFMLHNVLLHRVSQLKDAIKKNEVLIIVLHETIYLKFIIKADKSKQEMATKHKNITSKAKIRTALLIFYYSQILLNFYSKMTNNHLNIHHHINGQGQQVSKRSTGCYTINKSMHAY